MKRDGCRSVLTYNRAFHRKNFLHSIYWLFRKQCERNLRNLRSNNNNNTLRKRGNAFPFKIRGERKAENAGNLENGGNGTIHPPVHDTKRITRNSITDEWNPRGGVDRF